MSTGVPILTFISIESKYFLIFSIIIYMVLVTLIGTLYCWVWFKRHSVRRWQILHSFPFGRLLISNTFPYIFNSLLIILLWANLCFQLSTSLWDKKIHKSMKVYYVCEVAQSCLTLCNPMDCSLPGSSVHGIFQAIVLEWTAISFSKGSSQLRDQTQVSRIEGRRFNLWATREANS